MPDELANDRAYALELARRYFNDRSVTAELVEETFEGTRDPLIARLVGLIVNEPARKGRLITVSQRTYDKKYWPYVAEVLGELEKGPAGVVPPIPAASMRAIIGASIALLFVVVTALSDFTRFSDYFRPHGESPWIAALYLGGGLFMCVVAFVWLTRIAGAFRSRKDRMRGPSS